MQIVILRDLNPKKGLVVGAIKDWIRPVITEMEKQVGRLNGNFDANGEPIPDKSWYSFDMGLLRSVERTQVREQLRPVLPESQEASPEPVMAAGNLEPTSTAEAILADTPRAQRGPGRPRKTPALEPA